MAISIEAKPVRQSPLIGQVQRVDALLARTALMLARGQLPVAYETSVAAARLAEQRNDTTELAAALNLGALALERAGRHSEAAGLLAQARAALAGEAGENQGRRFERAAGGRDRDAIALLSARELEIVELAGLGYRNAEIADRLTLSRKTVENHLSRVFAKLGVSSRMAAAALLAEHRRVP